MKLDKKGIEIKPFGYELDANDKPVVRIVDTNTGKDYGSDPLGNGMFKMIPSGLIVGAEKRKAILGS